MRKADLVNQISDKTGIPKVDVLVTLETMFKEVKGYSVQREKIFISVDLAVSSQKNEPPKSDVISKRILLYIFLNIIFLPSSLQKNLLQKLKNFNPLRIISQTLMKRCNFAG